MDLQTFTRAHFPELCRWFPDEDALVQWGGPDVRFPLDEAQLAAMLGEAEGTVPVRWLFNGVAQNAMLAHCQVALDWRHGVARLSRVAVNPARRGQGLAVPFLREIVGKVLERQEFQRLELNVYTFNEAAIRTYRTIGFVEEGVRRSSVSVNGQRWDTAIFGLLRNEVPPA